MPWYFAYGSNMNLERVAARIGETRRVLAGSLEGYALRFNKASRVPGIAHANVVPAPGERGAGSPCIARSADLGNGNFHGPPRAALDAGQPARSEKEHAHGW